VTLPRIHRDTSMALMTTKHVTLRLAPDLHSWLVNAAAREHRSINGHVEWCLERERDRESLRVSHRDGDPHNSDPSNPGAREGAR
jgi:hypothetical protein